MLDSQQLAQVQHIFSRDVSRSPFRVWTATDACYGRVRNCDAFTKGDNKILNCTVVCVVEVSCQNVPRKINSIEQDRAEFWEQVRY